MHFHGARGPVVFMALVLLACAWVFVYTEDRIAAPTSQSLRPEISQDVAHQEERYKNRTMDIQRYIGTHIGELSPVQESLGGSFYVTEVTAANGKGVVRYEDGHMSYIADFTYTGTEASGYTVTKFRLRER